MLTELGAQVNITTEFHKETPQRVAEFSQYQQDAILSQLQNIEHLSDEQINDILSEAAKWDEGVPPPPQKPISTPALASSLTAD